MAGVLTPLEHQIQATFVRWCNLSLAAYPALRLSFAVPNAAKRSMALAARMKAEGLRAGVWDWWLPVPRHRWSGLTIEFKRPGEKLSQAQREYGDLLQSEGWRLEVCTTPEAAIEVVREYLGNGGDLWRAVLGDRPSA